MVEKDNFRKKETQDKLYEERAAKLWEIEYQKKISDQRELHLQKVSTYNIYSFKIAGRN